MQKKGNGYTTVEIVFMALIGVAFGVLFAFAGALWQFLNSALGPLGSGVLAFFMVPQALAVFVIRKPGVYFVATMINMTSQLLAGNPAGVACLAWGVVGGAGGEFVYWAFKYRRWDLTSMLLGPAAAILVNFPVSYYFFGWGSVPPIINISSTIINMLATGIESGWVAMALAKALHRAGLLGPYRISESYAPEQETAR